MARARDGRATESYASVRTAAERYAEGKALRAKVPRSAHAEWMPSSNRPDPVAMLSKADRTRVQELVPIRYGRMSTSLFAFYRGSASIMAFDLSRTPVCGVNAQLCGDAHLSNYGLFATPERNVIFDVNDFDETLRGPWEWDIKRLAASCFIAAADELRSTNGQIEYLLRRALSESGRLPDRVRAMRRPGRPPKPPLIPG